MNTILTIAGSDSGAGAGIQADLKTIAALYGYGVSVITALTAQNTLGVDAIMPVPVDFIEKQFNSIVADFDVKAVKIGMLPNVETIQCVAKLIEQSGLKNIVLDPVMVSSSGDKLVTEDTKTALMEYLVPKATIFTPNIHEAEVLLDNEPITNLPRFNQALIDLLKRGSESVVLKGGHLFLTPLHDVVDAFISEEENNAWPIHFRKYRIETDNLHGSGCTFSAAMAYWLAEGLTPLEAFQEAEKYVHDAIFAGSGLRLGKGAGPLWHFS